MINRPASKLMSFLVMNLVFFILSLTICNYGHTVEPEISEGTAGVGTDASAFIYGLPSEERLKVLYPDDAHRAKAIECITNLERAIRAIIQLPEVELNHLIETQSEVALLKISYAYLELQAVEKKGEGIEDDQRRQRAIEAELKKNLTGSSSDTTRMAQNLDKFYTYLYAYNNNLSDDFDTPEKQRELLVSIQNFSKKRMARLGAGTTQKQMYTITDGDIFVFQNLYKKYRPEQIAATNTGSTNLVEHMFHQLGRSFKSRNLGTSDRGEICTQMGGSRTDCNRKTGEGWYKKFENAKKKFSDKVKEHLKKFLKKEPPYADRGDHKCDDFINSDTLRFKPTEPNFKRAAGCTGDFLTGLVDTVPFNDIADVVAFLSPERTPNLPTSALTPHLHSRRMFHQVNSCRITRKPNGDFSVNFNLYLEHAPGHSASDAAWFINSGKPYAPDAQNYLNCSPPQRYDACVPPNVPPGCTNFSEGTGCIDRPVFPSNHQHDGSFNFSVNLGDTRQDAVTLIGTSEPITTTGNTMKSKPPSPASSETGSGPLMERRLDLNQCTGYNDVYLGASNGSRSVVGVVIIRTPEGDLDNVGLTQTHYNLQAKTQPAPGLTNGTYRWACKNLDVVPANKRSNCQKISKYANKLRNADFERLDEDYEVTVRYHSSVQRPEGPEASETIKIPKKRNITFAFTPISANSDNDHTAAKLTYTGDESEDIIKADNATWSWISPPPTGTVIFPADPSCSLATPKLDCQYKFPIQAEGYVVEARWIRPGWQPATARITISRSGINLTLREISKDDNSVKVKLTIEAPEAIIEAVKSSLKWKCSGMETPSPLCETTAATDLEITFERKNDNYSIQAEGTYTNALNQVETPRSGSLSIPKKVAPLYGEPIITLTPRVHPTEPNNKIQISATVTSSDPSKPLPPGYTFKWECETTTHPCNGSITPGAFKDFTKEEEAYNVKAIFEVSGRTPIERTSIVPRLSPTIYAMPQVSLAPNPAQSTNQGTHIELKTNLTFNPETGTMRTRIGYNWSCVPARDECLGTITGNEGIKQFERLSTAYNVQVTYTEEGGPGATATFPIPQKDAPIVATPNIVVEKNEAADYAKKATHVQCRAKYSFTPTGTTMEKDTFKWICPTGKSCSADIANPTSLGDFGPWSEFERDAANDYEVTAQLVTKTPVTTTEVKCSIPKKEGAVTYNLEISEDKTPDAAKAKFEANVFKSGSYEDVSGDGKIEWTYKSPSGAEIKSEGRSIEPERGTEDIKGKAIFKIGTEEKDSEEFTIKKKTSATDDDPGLEPLPEIPLSPPPGRFTPIILPPMPGMFITPGFD